MDMVALAIVCQAREDAIALLTATLDSAGMGPLCEEITASLRWPHVTAQWLAGMAVGFLIDCATGSGVDPAEVLTAMALQAEGAA